MIKTKTMAKMRIEFMIYYLLILTLNFKHTIKSYLFLIPQYIH